MNPAKRMIKIIIVVLAAIAVVCFVCHQIMESHYLKRNDRNTIDKAITACEKYDNVKSDGNRTKLIKALKDLVTMYAELKDRESGDRAYNAKWLCDLLSSSYDILEVDRDQISQLDNLLDGLHMLKRDPFDEPGSANDYILRFVKAN